MFQKLRVLVAFSLFAALLAGCANDDVIPGDPAAATQAHARLTLQSGDKLRINVYGEDKISGEYVIEPSGDVALPLAGAIKAAGKSPAELQRALTARLRSTSLIDPRVTVDVLSYRPFYILGEVQKPGDYPYVSGLNVLRAIAVAGGQTYRASDNTIIIQRAGEKQQKSYPLSADIPVYPGDLIRVPERYF
ncbi:polysaccharide export protein [Rhodoblastus acidophilus]|uniref:Polysaccharide export protein n=1 Tax=Candidatus Rhodoblastus alkanivorans TaxID=2954117 RepID=A0ABS9Z6J2_9HYPH|nr:polysaccharide biosynthesis/export family protein [Candidatus Rhodoblastus alkanivorans]MCI4679543.1 polysaccharide export protein [Candidatus Rhodoblastus alkanivorans]MCI4683294.1 polysaccharide export protein [Candidatus Rhodoblastus alkanivorans]MDI4640607.1 polysaccharide export protein [Rhodoblastus acidophilus]